MNRHDVISLCVRYAIVAVVGVSNLLWAEHNLFYTIFTPLTFYPVYEVLQRLYEATLFPPHTIFFKGFYATIIPACVAGSAYYLLFILAMTTPMAFKKRLFVIGYVFLLFLFLNIVRIVLFSHLLFKGYQYFDVAHLATWYGGSTLLVMLIWISALFAFRIREAPVFSDLKSIMKDIRRRNT